VVEIQALQKFMSPFSHHALTIGAFKFPGHSIANAFLIHHFKHD
jgi:hypothetical protein